MTRHAKQGPNDPDGQARYEQFLQLLARDQKRIRGLILSLVARPSVAEDLMQETMLVMWRKFGEFELGTDFAAWGMRIARYRVLRYCDDRRRDRLCFDVDALASIAACVEARGADPDKLAALEACVEKLAQDDRSLLELRYHRGMTVKQIAGAVGRSVHGLYKRMARIHALLYACVTREVRGQETGG
ncbi:MAG: sigma-70 family RNA polymerase sigma factor [Sedimentisphaerales bacterium]|nr:sigma-70 family RNA polymerase sigma factor [Sedimentisphaerales bacterium]